MHFWYISNIPTPTQRKVVLSNTHVIGLLSLSICTLYISTLNIFTKSHGEAQSEDYLPDTEGEAKTLLGLGRVNQATSRLDAAQKAFGLALDAIEAQTERLDLSEETRRRYRASFQRGYHSALAVAVARSDTTLALHLSERYRAGNLRTLLRTHRPGSPPDIPAEIEQLLLENGQRLAFEPPDLGSCSAETRTRATAVLRRPVPQ